MGKKGIRKLKTNFFSLSNEEQARYIERETKEVIKRLPRLKASLQMYGEISDELYNMSSEEVSLWGTTYAKAIRGGEISTPSSKQAYQRFINNLRKYARTPIKELAVETAKQRLESWLNNVKANGTKEDIAYAEQMLNSMSDEEKIGFTKSKYFLDTENWSSLFTYQSENDGMYSIPVLKLELYLEERNENKGENHELKHTYLNEVAGGKNINELRGYHKGKKKD